MNRVLSMMAALPLAMACVVVGTTCQAALIVGDSVSEDFNANVNNWAIAKVSGQPVTFTQDPNEGVDTPASGAGLFSNFSATNGTNDASAIYAPGGDPNDGKITFSPGNRIVTSISFQVDDANIAATPRLGIVADDVNFSLTNKDIIGGGGGTNTGIAILTRTGADKFLTVRNSDAGAASIVDIPVAIAIEIAGDANRAVDHHSLAKFRFTFQAIFEHEIVRHRIVEQSSHQKRWG